jgi:hypothetical protein
MRGTLAMLVALASVALIAASPASGSQTQVSGEQVLVDEATLQYELSGSLVGDWYTDSFDCHLIPGGGGVTWPCTGAEHFVGCLDSSRDGTCNQEETGELRFSFNFTGTPVGNGRCQHVITEGDDAFEGATGLLTFKDRLGVCGIETTYKGHISLD